MTRAWSHRKVNLRRGWLNAVTLFASHHFRSLSWLNNLDYTLYLFIVLLHNVLSCFLLSYLALSFIASFCFMLKSAEIPFPSSSFLNRRRLCGLIISVASCPPVSLLHYLILLFKDIRSSCQATQLLQSFLHTTKLLTSSHDNPKHFKSSLIVPHFHASDNIIQVIIWLALLSLSSCTNHFHDEF